MSTPLVDRLVFCGQSLSIRSYDAGLHVGLMEILCPQPDAEPSADNRPISLEFHLAGPEGFDGILPIDPAATPSRGNGLILDGQIYAESLHHMPDGRWWREYEGLGRQFWDLEQGRYCAVFDAQAFERHFPLRYLYLVIALSTFLRARQVMAVHAGCVVLNGKGLLFSAESGGGKSTTSLMMGQMGHPVLTDERIFLWAPAPGEYHAATLSDVVKVDQDTMGRFISGLTARDALCTHAGDVYFKLSRSHLAFQAQTPVHALCSLEIGHSQDTVWEPVSPMQVISGLFPVTMPVGQGGQMKAVFEFLMAMLRVIPCFKVRLGQDSCLVERGIRELAAQL